MVLRYFLLQVQVKLAISAVVKTQKMHTFALEKIKIMPKLKTSQLTMKRHNCSPTKLSAN